MSRKEKKKSPRVALMGDNSRLLQRVAVKVGLRCSASLVAASNAAAKRLGVPPPIRKVDRWSLLRDYDRKGLSHTPAPKASSQQKRHAAAPTTPQLRSTPFEASPEFLQSYEWRRLRLVVLKKYGRRCQCCGSTPDDGVTVINVDHIKPRRHYPELALSIENLQVLCESCNHGKGNWDETDWR